MLPHHSSRFVLPPISSFENLPATPNGSYTTGNFPFFDQNNNNYSPIQNVPVLHSNSLPLQHQQEQYPPSLVYVGIPVETSQELLKRPPPSENWNDNPVKKLKSEESIDIKVEAITQASFANVTNFCTTSKPLMKRFTEGMLQDFKHVIYNCLVDNYNSPEQHTFVQIYTINKNGITKNGFRFNDHLNPEKRVPELYARHIRKARLELQDQSSVFIQDLYKFYLRACIELLSKYFEKINKWTYLYEDIPLFVPNGSLEDAEERIRTMRTRTRKNKASKSK